MFVVCMYVCFQENPEESHLSMIKCIMRHFTSSSVRGLWYPKETDCALVGYFDSDFSDCELDHKSISGRCHLLANILVSWHSKKQANVALSISEA